MRHFRVRFLLVAALTAATLFAAAATAAAFSVTGVTVAPRAPDATEPGFGIPQLLPGAPTASGAHPVLDVTIGFDTEGGTRTARDVVQHFGPGIVANPHATGQCSQADFDEASRAPVACDPSTQVGTAIVSVLVPGPAVVPLRGIIYNLEPDAGDPGALGVALDLTPLGRPGEFLKTIARVTVDPTDLGLLTTLSDLSPVGPTSPPIVGMRLTLWGYIATGGTPPFIPFFTNPAACTTSTITVTATDHSDQTSTNSGSYLPTECDTAPFDTFLTVAANPSSTDSLSAISVDVKPAPIFVPRVNSYIKQNSITLPPGTLLNPALAASLDACTDAQFARSDPSVAPACPASSDVGRVTFVSPILGPFSGRAYFGTGNATDTLRLFLDVPLFGAHIKVIGGVRPDKTTGQVTTVFDDLPQVAFTDFQVDFNGPPLAVFTTPSTCGTNTASAINNPYSGGPASTPTGSFTTSYDGAGAACVTRFEPYFSGVTSTDKAGAKTSYTLKFSRPDRDARIDKVDFKLPAGLIGNLALRGLEQCSLADAAKGACGQASKVGTASVEIGSGPAPATLPGTVFLTVPKVSGDPAALSVLVPAKLGPVDLGNVIVGVRLQLRANGGLNAISDQIPQFQEGITTSIRVASIAINRDGFMRNPTSCGTKRYSGVFDAVGGAKATAYAKLTTNDCRRLAFRPRIRASIGARGKTHFGTHPPLKTTITQPNGQAAIRRAHVLLPRTVSTNTTALNAACSADDFAAGRCSKKAKIGTARAVSPLVSKPLRGPVYLVKQPRGLPKLVAQLRGPLSLDLTGRIEIGKKNKIATTFPAVPDLTVTSFTLSFHSGRYGILAAVGNLCRSSHVLPSKFTGQNGKKVSQRADLTVKGCTKKR